MKVIKIDNFNRDNVSDVLICENVKKYIGEFFVKSLNEAFSSGNSPDFFRLVPDDYKLYEWKP